MPGGLRSMRPPGNGFAEMDGDVIGRAGGRGEAQVAEGDPAEIHEDDAGRDVGDLDRRFRDEVGGCGRGPTTAAETSN